VRPYEWCKHAVPGGTAVAGTVAVEFSLALSIKVYNSYHLGHHAEGVHAALQRVRDNGRTGGRRRSARVCYGLKQAHGHHGQLVLNFPK
jgi:hypothetical protein